MLTLEQLFPTKLYETDPDRVRELIDMLPRGRRMIVRYGSTLTQLSRSHENFVTAVYIVRDQDKTRYVNANRQFDPDTYTIYGPSDRHPIIASLHPPPDMARRGNMEYRNGQTQSLDLGKNCPLADEWYPNYGNSVLKDYWHLHRAALREIRHSVFSMRFMQPCKDALEGQPIDQDRSAWMAAFKTQYPSVYGKSGYRLRKLAIAAQNALVRLLIMMKRFTTSLWRMVPIELCRYIAAILRPYKMSATQTL